jgi:hypothetical protein
VLENQWKTGWLTSFKKLVMNFVQINLHHSKTTTAILFFYFLLWHIIPTSPMKVWKYPASHTPQKSQKRLENKFCKFSTATGHITLSK